MQLLTGPVIQSAINFSEGRRAEVVEAIAEAGRGTPGVVLADCSADPDHNRMVASLLGGPEPVRHAALAMARVAVARIDLRRHTGAHPRIGAVDVVPVVPIRGVTMEECLEVAARIGQDFARELGLPVYFYERSARPGRRSALPEIRRGGFEGLFREPPAGPRVPDLGPAAPHPTAGAVVVGAREPLVACNVNLDTPDPTVAKRIAATIRRERDTRPLLAGVRALGLFLPSRSRAQVSMNLTRPARTPLPAVFDCVRQEAARLAVNVYESEIIGLLPRHALGGEPPERILWRGFRQTQILEYWLEKL
jgi:glutamate formiminotransferase